MPFGMTLVDGPIPNDEDLVWDSTDLGSDFIPMTERFDKPDILWWCIDIDENVTKARYKEMLSWCIENAQYQCGIRYNDDYFDSGFIVGYFRHPADAMAFKLAWL